MTPPSRDPRLDALRGWLQISIFISHAAGSVLSLWIIHAAWGVSDSSEQFVFLSGFALGSVFLWKESRQGFGAALRDLRGRFGRLWRMHMVVFLGFGLMLALACTLWGAAAWPHAMERPWMALLGGALTLYQPPFMGILPVFLWGMVALPAFAWLEARHGARALALPALLYALALLLPPDWPGMGGTTLAFSPPAWVALFLLGAFFGRRALRRGAAIGRHPWLVAGALGVLAMGLAMRLLDWQPPGLVGKEQLAPLRLLHALALAYLVAVLIPGGAAWAGSAWGRALGTIGRQSLPVFSLGLFLSWMAAEAFRAAPAQQAWTEPLLLGLGILLLWRFARALDAARAAPQLPRNTARMKAR